MKVIQFIVATALIAGPVLATLSQPASANGVGGTGAAHGARSASVHSTFHQSTIGSTRRHRGRQAGAFWPAAAGLYYGPASGNPEVGVPVSGGVHDTCTYDIPWDWVHRCPPFASSPEPVIAPPVLIPRVTGCAAQTVTVARGNGKEQTVTIVRC